MAKIVLALADQAFVSLNSFVTMMVVAKLCSADELAVYVLALSILFFFRVIQERLLGAPYVVFAHQAHRENSAFLGSSLIQQAFFSIASGLAFLGLSALTNLQLTPAGLGECFVVIAIAIGPILLRDHLRAVSCTHFRYAAAALMSGVALVLQLLIIFVAYRYQVLTPAVVFAAMGVASLLPVVVWMMTQPEPYVFVRSQLSSDSKACFDYSRWLVAARFFPTLVNSLLPWIVLWMVSKEASGIWGSCTTLANVSMMFVTGCNNLFQPRAVVALQTQGKNAMWQVLQWSAVVFTIALSLVCLVYLIAGERLLALAFNPTLAQYGMVVTLLSVHVLICSLSIVAGNGLAAMEKSRGIFAGELAWSLVTVLAAVVLTAEFELVGMAVAICLGSLTATIVEGGSLVYWLKTDRRVVQESIA